MPTIRNESVAVELDAAWPRIVRSERRASDVLPGCDPDRPFAVELNGERYDANALECTCEVDQESALYALHVPELDLTMRLRFAVEGNEVVFSLQEVEEAGKFQLKRFYFPEHRLVTGTAQAGDSYFRRVTRRANWDRYSTPGAWNGGWEDHGPVGCGVPEDLGPLPTAHAAVWNEGVCAAFNCSIHQRPLVSILDEEDQVLPGRTGRFSVWAGQCWYRLRSEPAKPFELRIGLLGDYDGNGRIDWCDAANWEGDRAGVTDYDLYPETIIYKMYLDDPRRQHPLRTLPDVLEEIRIIHDVSGGKPQICYLVGWQEGGHDACYPCHTRFNERGRRRNPCAGWRPATPATSRAACRAASSGGCSRSSVPARLTWTSRRPASAAPPIT